MEDEELIPLSGTTFTLEDQDNTQEDLSLEQEIDSLKTNQSQFNDKDKENDLIPLKGTSFSLEEPKEPEDTGVIPLKGTTFSLAEPEEEDNFLDFLQDFGSDLLNLSSSGVVTTGVSQPPEAKPPKTRFFNAINSFFQGAPTVLEGLLKGNPALQTGIDRNIQKNLKKAIATSKGIDPKDVDENTKFGTEATVKNSELLELGRTIENQLREVFPTNPEFRGELFADIVPRGLGTFAGQATTALLTRGKSLTPLATTAINATINSIAFSGLEFDRALKESGGDEDQAFEVFLKNLPINSLEALPVLAGVGKLNKITSGGFVKMLKGLSKTRLGVGLIEGTQEVAQEYGQNLVASGTYDKTRDLFNGLQEAGTSGFIIGTIIRSFGISIRRRTLDPRLTQSGRAELINSLRFAQREVTDMILEGKMTIQDIRPEALDQVGRQTVENERTRNQINALLSPIFDPEVVPTAPELASEISRNIADKTKNEENDPGDQLELDFKPQEENSADVTDERSTVLMDNKDGTLKNRLKRKIRKMLLPSGSLPRKVFESIRKVGFLDRETVLMQQTLKDLTKGFKEEFGIRSLEQIPFSDKVPNKVFTDMRGFLEGDRKKLLDIPEQIQKPLKDMRSQMDRLSQTLIDEGISEGQLNITITKNLGTYIHRTFKKHTQPRWADKVPTDVKNRAFFYIKDAYKEVDNELSDNQVSQIVEELLYSKKTSPAAILRGESINSINLSPLKKRGEIAQPIRELLGEEKNPVVNYVQSVSAVARLIQSHKELVNLRENFLGEFVFKADDPEGDPRAIPITDAKNSDALAPLNGFKVAPEIRQALEERLEVFKTSTTMRTWLTLNTAAKFSATILNPSTISRNVVGGSFFLLFNGHNPAGKHFKTGFKVARSAFKNPDTKEGREQIQRLAELRILNSSPQSGEVNDLTRDLSSAGNFEQLTNFMMGRGLSSKVARGVKKASDFYQAGDNFLRTMFYFSELDQLRDTELGKSLTESELEEEAARITNRLYQNYDFIPKAFKGLRKAPVAPFAAFNYEITRTTVNAVDRIKTELGDSDPKMNEIGRKRLMGAALTGGLSLAASITSGMLAGVTSEDEKEIRRHAAPWDKNATLLFLNSEPGEAKYLNLTYIDPYSYLKDPIITALSNRGLGTDTLRERIFDVLEQVFEPLFSEEIFVTNILELRNNRRDTGGQIWNPQDELGTQIADASAHLWKAFNPGALKQSANIYESLDNEETDKEFSNEVLGLFGFRITKIDFRKSLGFKINEFKRQKRDSRRILTTVENDNTTTRSDELEAKVKANVAFQTVFEEFSKDIDAAISQGVSRFEIEEILRERNLSQAEIDRLLLGGFQGFELKGRR